MCCSNKQEQSEIKFINPQRNILLSKKATNNNFIISPQINFETEPQNYHKKEETEDSTSNLNIISIDECVYGRTDTLKLKKIKENNSRKEFEIQNNNSNFENKIVKKLKTIIDKDGPQDRVKKNNSKIINNKNFSENDEIINNNEIKSSDSKNNFENKNNIVIKYNNNEEFSDKIKITSPISIKRNNNKNDVMINQSLSKNDINILSKSKNNEIDNFQESEIKVNQEDYFLYNNNFNKNNIENTLDLDNKKNYYNTHLNNYINNAKVFIKPIINSQSNSFSQKKKSEISIRQNMEEEEKKNVIINSSINPNNIIIEKEIKDLNVTTQNTDIIPNNNMIYNKKAIQIDNLSINENNTQKDNILQDNENIKNDIKIPNYEKIQKNNIIQKSSNIYTNNNNITKSYDLIEKSININKNVIKMESSKPQIKISSKENESNNYEINKKEKLINQDILQIKNGNNVISKSNKEYHDLFKSQIKNEELSIPIQNLEIKSELEIIPEQNIDYQREPIIKENINEEVNIINKEKTPTNQEKDSNSLEILSPKRYIEVLSPKSVEVSNYVSDSSQINLSQNKVNKVKYDFKINNTFANNNNNIIIDKENYINNNKISKNFINNNIKNNDYSKYSSNNNLEFNNHNNISNDNNTDINKYIEKNNEIKIGAINNNVNTNQNKKVVNNNIDIDKYLRKDHEIEIGVNNLDINNNSDINQYNNIINNNFNDNNLIDIDKYIQKENEIKIEINNSEINNNSNFNLNKYPKKENNIDIDKYFKKGNEIKNQINISYINKKKEIKKNDIEIVDTYEIDEQNKKDNENKNDINYIDINQNNNTINDYNNEINKYLKSTNKIANNIKNKDIITNDYYIYQKGNKNKDINNNKNKFNNYLYSSTNGNKKNIESNPTNNYACKESQTQIYSPRIISKNKKYQKKNNIIYDSPIKIDEPTIHYNSPIIHSENYIDYNIPIQVDKNFDYIAKTKNNEYVMELKPIINKPIIQYKHIVKESSITYSPAKIISQDSTYNTSNITNKIQYFKQSKPIPKVSKKNNNNQELNLDLFAKSKNYDAENLTKIYSENNIKVPKINLNYINNINNINYNYNNRNDINKIASRNPLINQYKTDFTKKNTNDPIINENYLASIQNLNIYSNQNYHINSERSSINSCDNRSSIYSARNKKPKFDKLGNPIYNASLDDLSKNKRMYNNNKIIHANSKIRRNNINNVDYSPHYYQRSLSQDNLIPNLRLNEFNDYSSRASSPHDSPLSSPRSNQNLKYLSYQKTNLNKINPLDIEVDPESKPIIYHYLNKDLKNFASFSYDSFKLFYPQNERYFNIPKNEIITEQQIITYINNDPNKKEKYIGGFNILGNRHGYGRLIAPSFKRIGTWQNGKFTGWGREIRSNGQVFEGKFKDGKITGKGVYKYKDIMYIGDFEKNIRQGKGEKITKHYYYSGYFDNDKINGYGRIQFINAEGGESEYEGFFKDNNIEGKGIMKWKNGNVYEGEMKNNAMDGQGILRLNNGIVKKGIFEEGEFIENKNI